ncbi:response regulator transcription factor [Rubeoparvulum massiliense]|uniref:response regulator transcription factor n=1 Tax=Rubeoparvulum massiliense TaxID=1631346 RepID=UPI00065E788C|nr:response regulator transcription factor [Rubeoparvulum massiliense]
MNDTILLVEDDPSIRGFVRLNLLRQGYEVLEAETGEKALALLSCGKPILIAVLDIMLPGMDGIEVCKQLRSQGYQIGIMMLTAKTQELDKVEGLLAGADDYMTKPFSPLEFMARIKALQRRLLNNQNVLSITIIESGPFTLDQNGKKVWKNNTELDLTPTEYALMRHFMLNKGIALSRNDLLDEIWGVNYVGDYKVVDVNIRRLRKKIEDDPSQPIYIEAIWGFGYCWRGQ